MTLAELDAAYAAMTPGPWEDYSLDDAWPGIEGPDGTLVIHGYYRDNGDDDGGIRGENVERANANARGIAALNNAFPALRDRLKRAEELLARAEQALLPLATAAQDAGVCVGCVTATELETARKVREEILAAIETQRATT